MNDLLSTLLLALPPEDGAGASSFSSFLPLILIVVVFYLFMIRPQMKKQKELRKFRSELKKGDKVVTTGGIYGKVTDIQERVVFIEVDDKIRLKVDINAVVKDMSDVPQK